MLDKANGNENHGQGEVFDSGNTSLEIASLDESDHQSTDRLGVIWWDKVQPKPIKAQLESFKMT